MTDARRQVRRARNRLWLNLWLDAFCKTLAVVAVVFVIVAKIAQARFWDWPILTIAVAALGLTGVVSLIISMVRRPGDREAAAALDEAAGLRERVSSSLYLEDSDDPFAVAMRADADAKAASLTVRRHLRLKAPNSIFGAGAAVLAAALLWLIPASWLQSAAAEQSHQKSVQVTQTQVAVKERLEQIKKQAQTNPALADMREDIEKLDAMDAQKMQRPGDLRREGLKRIDRLTDAVRDKRADSRYDKVTETRKMLRALKDPQGEKTTVSEITRKLAAGDFKSAKESIHQLQEQLATLKHDGDKEMVKKLSKQLKNLAKQLENVSSQEQLKKKLEQAGVKKEDVERMLEKLTKKDLDQVKKQLEKNGMSQMQIEQIAKQMQKQQGAKQTASKMSSAMKSAAQSAGDGQTGDAASSLDAAADQLSELEQLEQEMNELDSAMSDLQDGKDDMQNRCSQCNGTGQKDGGTCPGCNGTGMGQGQQGRGGMGPNGKGRGGLAKKQSTGVGFKVTRQKVKTTKGRIVGQFLVDGEQVKGETASEIVEVIAAAQRDATDTVNHDRIPRQYQDAVKEYFSRLPAQFGGTATEKAGDSESADDNAATDEASANDAADDADAEDDAP